MSLHVTICGGGAIGHVTAGVWSLTKNIQLNILSGRPDKWHNKLVIYDPDGKVLHANINRVSADPEELIPQSDIVYLCLPGYLIEKTLREIAPCLKRDTYIGSCVSSSGFFFAAERCLPENTKLFGFQRVPYIARINEYGSSAFLLGYKPTLNLAVRNIDKQEQFAHLMEALCRTPISLLPSYFDAALTNSNPILHPCRLYGMWHDWNPDKIYSKKTLFYEDWDEFSAAILIQCDQDFFNVIRNYPCTPGALPKLLDYYESKNASELAAKLRSISAFKGIYAPMLSHGDGFVPDFANRYFTEDIPFGLKIIKRLADKAGESVPAIDLVLAWADKMPIPRIS